MPIPGGPLTNIANYRNVIRDISRPYLFMIRIPFLGDDYTVTAFARSSQLPAYQLETVNVPFQSQNLRLAGPANFEGTWTVNFLADEAHSIRKRFLQWMQTAYNPATLTHGHPFEYKVDNVQIHQLGRTGNTVAYYNLVGAYVSQVGTIDVSHDSSTEPEKFDVTFTYDYWVMDTNNVFGAQMIGGGSGVNVGINIGIGGGGVGGSANVNVGGGGLNLGVGFGF